MEEKVYWVLLAFNFLLMGVNLFTLWRNYQSHLLNVENAKLFEKARDEAADDGKWMGGSHGRAVHGAWISGANWAERYMLEKDKRVRGLVEALKEIYLCEKHDWEPNTTMDYIRCDKCGIRPRLADAPQAFEREREAR